MTVKVVHVGLGGWGQDWAKNVFGPVAGVERVGWVDAWAPTLEMARTRLDLPPDRCFSSLAEAFDKVDADAVLITAPQAAHVPLAIEAMTAGKHVLVEKPLAASVAEAREAVEVSERTGKVLMVSQQYRHYPAVRRTVELIENETYGPAGMVRVDFRKWSNRAPKEGHKHYGILHPLIYDMAIHHFDLMRLVLGSEAVRVFALVTDPPWSKFEQEGAAAITIEFASGQVVSYRGSWVSPGRPTNWAGEWNIECERGNIFFTSRQGLDAGTSGDVVRVLPLDGEETQLKLDSPRLWGRSAGLAAFAKAIETGTEPETSGRNNLGSIALMAAAARSTETGKAELVEATI